MIKISPSRLDMYQDFLNKKMSKRAYIKKITDPFITSPNMEFGTLFHSIIETGEIPPLLCDKSNIYRCALLFRDIYDTMKHEIAGKSIIEISNGELIEITYRVDGIDNNIIHEHKTTIEKKQESYFKSWQWKVYLYLLDKQKIQYNIFYIKPKKSKYALFNAYSLEDFIENIDTIQFKKFVFTDYFNMQTDVLLIIESFVNFLKENKLDTLPQFTSRLYE